MPKLKDLQQPFMHYLRVPEIPMEGQQPSTVAIISRPVEKDAEHFNRVIKDWKAVPNAKTTDELVNAKLFDPTQVAIVEDIRRHHSEKRSTYAMRSQETEWRKSTPEGLKLYEKAVNAFTYSQPAPLTEKEVMEATMTHKMSQLTQIVPYVPTHDDLPPIVRKKTWHRFLPRWLRDIVNSTTIGE